jgi:hypothetical protein
MSSKVLMVLMKMIMIDKSKDNKVKINHMSLMRQDQMSKGGIHELHRY